MAHDAHARYSQIMADVERLIDDHIAHPAVSKLKLLVPTVGLFFTPISSPPTRLSGCVFFSKVEKSCVRTFSRDS
ncbi:IMP-specific 5'-nucleotidase 1 [Teratosphaeria destructans]|uniref:IMP-specific 5'-nucleotidase 1 n=1 Tax=Teratosphaeria destructans TaxID=418781 RepID=A0A9W7T1V8_9PEZI|nr:IMP-specific 5'-nucleotidase 1 [Teratosphaeria destructans]